MQKPRPAVLAVIFVLCVAVKLVPYVLRNLGIATDPSVSYYPWNFTPMLPLCLFGAAFYSNWRLSFLLPLAAWLVGDLGIWALTGRWDWAFYKTQPVVYAMFAVMVALGFTLQHKRSFLRVAAAGLGGGTLFFVVTNFATWAFGTRYTHDWSGFVLCYEAAIPFYRNTLISMAVFLPVLFSRLTVIEPSLDPAPTIATPLGAQ